MSDSNQGHECSACGGTGRKQAPKVHHEYRDVDGYWIELGDGWQLDGVHGITEDTKTAARRKLRDVTACHCAECQCPACHGSGRISDVMPVSDALADAETFVSYLATWPLAARFEEAYPAIGQVQRVGLSVLKSVERGHQHKAAWKASVGARAAFRAVPGLRG